MKRFTLKEIGQQLNLSPGTISKALNDSHEISAETKKLILDWSTAKFVNANFAVNSEYGDIMDILMKWIEIFMCEVISPCSVESIYPLNIRVKEPQYYNFFLYRTKVPFNLDIEAINIIWINKFTEYLEENHSNLALKYEENKIYPLNRPSKNIKAFFILHRKN